MDNLIVIGTGEGVNSVGFDLIKNKLDDDYDVLAFQEAYPNLRVETDGVAHRERLQRVLSGPFEPDMWFWSDPNSALKGLKHIIANVKTPEFTIPKILIPEFMLDDYATFRMFCGTTPLGRKGGWSEYKYLLKTIPHLALRSLKSTTTKYVSQNPYSERDLMRKDWLGSEVEHRFNSKKIIFGSVYFDSEQVIGARYSWGLESKLSSYVFPLIHSLGYKNIYICGFGMKGGRFFDQSATRMPHNDETQIGSQHEFPLSVIKKWVDWKSHHGMTFYSLESDQYSYLNKIMECVV
jgi:hypothetical protein